VLHDRQRWVQSTDARFAGEACEIYSAATDGSQKAIVSKLMDENESSVELEIERVPLGMALSLPVLSQVASGTGETLANLSIFIAPRRALPQP
jgi:hypothetical protein